MGLAPCAPQPAATRPKRHAGGSPPWKSCWDQGYNLAKLIRELGFGELVSALALASSSGVFTSQALTKTAGESYARYRRTFRSDSSVGMLSAARSLGWHQLSSVISNVRLGIGRLVRTPHLAKQVQRWLYLATAATEPARWTWRTALGGSPARRLKREFKPTFPRKSVRRSNVLQSVIDIAATLIKRAYKRF